MSQLIWAVVQWALWDLGWIWDAIGGWDGCAGHVSFCLLSAMEGVLPGMLLGIAHVEHHETTGGLSFSTPVGEDVERRQGGGMFPDYSWVPVGASWKTSVTGRFPKDRKPWNKAKNSWPRLSSEVRMITVVMAPSVSWA